MSQLVQKLSTTIPEFKQTNFATTQQASSNELEEDDNSNQDYQNTETESVVMSENDNIDQTTNQNFYFSQDILYEVKY